MYCVNLITTSSIYIANDVYFLGGHFNLIVYRQYLKHNIGRSANKFKYLYSNQSKHSTNYKIQAIVVLMKCHKLVCSLLCYEKIFEKYKFLLRD